MNRREFLKASTAAGGGLVLGVAFSACAGPQRRRMRDVAEQSGAFRPNMYLTITPENRVEVDVEKSEMGQGVLTSHAMLVAEELEIDLDRVDASSADAAPQYETSYGQQNTGGSTSLAESYEPVRKAAAAAREMLVTAAAVRWSVPRRECRAEDGRVHHRSSDRSVRYGELTREAAQVSIPSDPPIKDPEDFELLGSGAGRVDGREKVDGTAVFGIDVEVPDAARAYCLHPPVFGAEPTSVEADEAEAMDGVLEVVVFERGVAVVAEKHWQAKRAADTVDVEWGGARGDGLDTEAIETTAAETARGSGKVAHNEGNVDRELERDEVTVVEAEYASPYLAHAPMEPQNCTVDVRDGEVEIWVPTQSPTVTQEAVARVAGVGRQDVEVHPTLLGGAFGRRLVPDFVIEAVRIAMEVDRPVKLLWSREQDTAAGYYRPINHNVVEAALDDDGRPLAWRYHNVSPPIAADWDPFLAAAMPNWVPKTTRQVLANSFYSLNHSGSAPELLALEGAEPLYDVEHVRLEYTPIRTPVPVCQWRSVGNSYNGFVVESFVDELADAADRDPYEYRRELLEGQPRMRHVLERAAEEADWGSSTAEEVGRGIAVKRTFGTPVAQCIEAGIDEGDIVIDRIVCVVDCGIAVNPDLVRAQMEGGIIYGLSAALHQKITLTDGAVDQGNFDDFPAIRMHESPDIDVVVVDSGEDPTGVGEPGVPPAAPALANAIYDATGIRLRRMPFDDALQAALDEEEL